jgi:GntR family transcriptional regulator, rspAB operon transcriptional repressor
VKVNVDRIRRLTLPLAGRMTGVIAEHVAILSAIEQHDEDGAAAAMGKHLARLFRDISAVKDLNPEYFDGPS